MKRLAEWPKRRERSMRWFRRVSGDAVTVKSAPDEMTNQKTDAARSQ